MTTRWQAYVRPVGKTVPLDRSVLEATLQELHQDYQGHMTATLTWGGGGRDSDASGQDFLDRIVEYFWATVQRHTS
ncbi:HTH cro/C1-type domain-containing protein OS=Streptomyces glaucescens OX=1907 GN=SGLAU_23320 PE=4 SV=1 [Streptomyces glaucescens]